MSVNVPEALARVPLFASLDRKHLEKLAKDVRERSFPAGAVVVKQGDERGVGFFIVATGEAQVSVDGREVSRVGPGDYFGEVALISDRVRTATVTAATDLECLVMTVWDFRSFVHGNADVAWALLEHLATMLHRAGHARP